MNNIIINSIELMKTRFELTYEEVKIIDSAIEKIISKEEYLSTSGGGED